MSGKEKAFTWTIDGALLNKVLQSKNKDTFKSEEYEIEDLKWQIEICPNGYKKAQMGSFQIYVALVTLPEKWKRVIVTRSIECPETQSGITVLATYNKSGHSRGWATNTLRLKEITDLRLAKMSIKVKTKILRIISNDDTESVLYNYPLTNADYKRSILKWRLDRKTLKIAQKAYNGKCIVSDIFNDIWCIKLLPNGSCSEEKGQCMLGLQLCNNLNAISAIDVQFNISIKQLNFDKTFTKKYIFLKGSQWINVGTFENVLKCDDLSVVIHVLILNEYDSNDNYIIQSQNDFENEEIKKKQQLFDKSMAPIFTLKQEKDRQIQALNAELRQYKSEMNYKFSMNSTRIESLSSNMSEMQSKMDLKEGKLNEINYEMSKYSHKLQTFNASIDQNIHQMRQTMEIVQSIQTELEQTQSVITEMNNGSKSRETYNKQINSKLTALNQNLAQMQRSIQSIQNGSTVNQNKFAQIRHKMSAVTVTEEKKESENGCANGLTELEKLQNLFETDLKMPQYIESVIEGGYDSIAALYAVNNQDLKTMNVKIAHRKKILKLIQQKQESSNKEP